MFSRRHRPPAQPVRLPSSAAALVAALLPAVACSSDDPEFICLAIQKDVSTDGGRTFVASDLPEQAPEVSSAEAASYRITVSNCGSLPLSSFALADEGRLLPMDIGVLGPGDQQTFTDSPGMSANRVCAAAGARLRPSRVTATALPAPAAAAQPGLTVEAMDVAWLICKDAPCGDGDLDVGEECDDGNTTNDDACRNDCTLPRCSDGVVDAGEACDDGNSDPNDGCSPECNIETAAECAIEIEQTCRVVGADSGSVSCEGSVVAMTLEYTGEGCGATTNAQSGKVSCQGGADFATPVSMVATDKRGSRIWGRASAVELGGTLRVTAAEGGRDKLDPDTVVTIDDGLELVRFHTSCSKPLAVGDRFGSVRVVELTTTEGGTSSLPPGSGSDPSSQCTILSDPVGTPCDRKVSTVMLRYVGGSCSASSQDQGGKLKCTGDAGTASPVRIVASEKSGRGGPRFLDQDGVALGDVITISAATARKKELEATTYVVVISAAGATLQTLKIQTSCSKPLALGDRFGAFEVVGLAGKRGSSTLGALVEYVYTATNRSVQRVLVDIFDDRRGVIAEDLPLEPGETVTFVDFANITEETSSTSTAVAVTPDGLVCADEADTTVLVAQPPPRFGSCADGKPAAAVFEYTGAGCGATTNDQSGKVRCSGDPAGAVSVTVRSRGGSVSPGVVALGQTFTLSGGRGKLSPQSDIELRVGGRVVQSLSIHTSCSKPLNAGDRFGGVRLVGLILAD